jgi:predicted flap endonuclease-1-like 5' DNA nuclease
MFTPANTIIGVLVLALLGVLAGWLRRRWRADSQRQATEAYESEVVRAVACARDRAREEKEIAEDRLARLMLEHKRCPDDLAAMQSRLEELGATLQASKWDREEALEARDAESARARGLEERVAELVSSIEERNRRDDTPEWLDHNGDGSRRDDLTAIRGLGTVLENRLNRLGIYRYRQLARLTSESAKWLAPRIRVLGGRITRDRWAEQARKLHEKSVTLSRSRSR